MSSARVTEEERSNALTVSGRQASLIVPPSAPTASLPAPDGWLPLLGCPTWARAAGLPAGR